MTKLKDAPTKLIDGIEVQPCKCCYNGFKNGGTRAPKGSLFYPVIIKLQDLYYAQCSNPECHAYHQHEFIGLKPKGAYENWNSKMKPAADSIFD